MLWTGCVFACVRTTIAWVVPGFLYYGSWVCRSSTCPLACINSASPLACLCSVCVASVK